MALTIQACRKGSDVTLYYNTGTDDTPVWVEHIGMVEDLDMNETDDLNELNGRRAARIVKEYGSGETELSITGTQIHDANYEGWLYLNSARPGGTSKDIMVLSGKLNEGGAYGWRGDFWNSDRTNRGPASGDLVSAVNLQPAAPCKEDHVSVRVVKVSGSTGSTGGTASVFDPTVFVAG